MKSMLQNYPSEKLLKKTTEIQIGQLNSEWFLNLVEDMQEIMDEEGGIGLAANQIGYEVSAIIVEKTVMINPQINECWGDLEKDIEGCLSIPGKLFEVERPNGLFVSYLDINGKTCKENLYGLRGRVFQHELDHLNGITLENNWQAKEIKKQLL